MLKKQKSQLLPAEKPKMITKGLLQYRTIELNGEIEAIFDATIALERLDDLMWSAS